MNQRRAVAVVGLVATTMLLAACGFDAPAVENSEHSQVQGTSFAVGAVKIRAAFVTTVPTVDPTSIAAAGGTPMALVVTLINENQTTADALTGVTSSIGQVILGGRGTTAAGLPIPRRGVPVQIEDPNLRQAGATLIIAAKSAPAVGGFVRVNFTFKNAGTSATVQVPVVPPGESEQATTRITGVPATPPPNPGDTTD